jgi:hypothetical protein
VIRPAVLLFALVITAPAVYRYVLDQLDVTEVLIRFIIAVPIAALLLAALRFVTAGYGKTEDEETQAAPPTAPLTPTPVESHEA